MENPAYRSFDRDLSGTYPGRLRVDPTFLGIGGFKTAQSGLLMLMPPSASGLGSLPHQDIVVKRPFFTPASAAPSTSNAERQQPHRRIARFSLLDELPKLHCEANTLYWAKAIFKMTYDFIDHAVDLADAPPPFTIPRLRFVDAGLALAHSAPRPSIKGKAPSGTLCSVYLLEEKIEGGSAAFTKFIHNMDCGLSLEEDEDGYDIAEFLAFTQHVQYEQTSKLVFISDYQGT